MTTDQGQWWQGIKCNRTWAGTRIVETWQSGLLCYFGLVEHCSVFVYTGAILKRLQKWHCLWVFFVFFFCHWCLQQLKKIPETDVERLRGFKCKVA